jgi:hypothetical protein
VWKLVLSRLYTSDIDGKDGCFVLNIGPCDRHGKKTNNSISYQFEGIMYRFFIMMETLYPFMMKRIKRSMSWSVNKMMSEYYHMLKSIKYMCSSNSNNSNNFEKDSIKIITPLWEHQEKTSSKFFKGMILDKKRGFGDASYVGSGKTLTTLSLLSKLYNYDATLVSCSFSGFLVMLPSIQLIKTWVDEIKKHTTGFDTYVQNSSGDFISSKNEKIKLLEMKVKPNTIIITTMGRTRDHPLQHSWILVIVDECLSVQNKEALQTEEAWRQSCYSQYGILMLSATFFRSRFDKMLYMLKMLKTGLPEEVEYLDTILNESIVSNITESDRIWKITTSKIEMSPENYKEYEEIYKANSNKGSEILYNALSQYIHENVDYIDIFYDQIEALESENVENKIIIFTKSKNEADKIIESERNTNNWITRYPDKTGAHTVLSFSEGTYGLNNLVIYNTILMRPPEPDKLPQIKGRLDRPGQQAKNLYIKYVLLKNTIEEAALIRLELCNNFYNNYLMPLAEFYDLAVKVVAQYSSSSLHSSNILQKKLNNSTI